MTVTWKDAVPALATGMRRAGAGGPLVLPSMVSKPARALGPRPAR